MKPLAIGPVKPRPSPNAAVLRIARVLADRPKLQPVAFGLVRSLGVVDAAPEIEWLAENIQ